MPLELDPPVFKGEGEVVLTLRYDIPMWMEQKLIHFYGFKKGEQKYNQYHKFIRQKGESKFQKSRKMTMQEKIEHPVTCGLIRSNPDLSITVQAELLRRIDNVVSFFKKPYDHVPAVRQRLHNLMQGLKTQAERDFVHDFMEDEFPANQKKA